jgi:hypothetical protein
MLASMQPPIRSAVRLRRSLAYALLSLLLVLSQQMGISHGMSHWTDARSAAQGGGPHQRAAAKSLALDQSCAQCLAFAQIGSALGTPAHAVAATHAAAAAGIAYATPAGCLRTVCVFQSRAPPVLA